MKGIFLCILELSVNSMWIILAVIALRLVLKRLPKAVCFIMWTFAAIKLLVPFSFKTPVSIAPKLESLYSEGASSSDKINFIISHNSRSINELQIVDINTSSSKSGIIDIMQLLSVIWIIVCIIMLIYCLFSYIRLHIKVSARAHLKENIYMCDNISFPFIMGILFPKIYLPSSVSDEQTFYVLAHEKEHLKHLDHILKPLAYVILSVHWFNPLVWVAYILFCRDIEFACDERVVRKKDKGFKNDYSKTLLALNIPRPLITACPVAFGEIGVKKRILSVLNYKKPSFFIILISIILCIAAILFFATDPLDYDKIKSETDTEAVTANNKITDNSENEIDFFDKETERETENLESTMRQPVNIAQIIKDLPIYSFDTLEEINDFLFDMEEDTMPESFAVISSDVDNFAIITEYAKEKKQFRVKRVLYKNVDISPDVDLWFRGFFKIEKYNDIIFLSLTYFYGEYIVLTPDSYLLLGFDKTRNSDFHLDRPWQYSLSFEEDKIKYAATSTVSAFYAPVDCSGVEYINSFDDLKREYFTFGYIEYVNGEWNIIEEQRQSLEERFPLEEWFENLKEYEEELNVYETLNDYIKAKESGEIPPVILEYDEIH